MPSSFVNPAITNPTIGASNNRLTSPGYSYDASGNTTADAGGQTYVYDAENKMISASNSSGTLGEYFYDGDGKRVKKHVPATGELTIFVYDAGGKLIVEYSTEIPETPKVSYTTSDHLGSPRIITDENGMIVSRRDYMPFGEEIFSAGRTTALGYTADTIRQKFTGYERDNETSLDFAQARMYANHLGRFSTCDPYKIVAEVRAEGDSHRAKELLKRFLVRPEQWNAYIYAINNPLRYRDPSGEKVELQGKTDAERAAERQRIRNILGEERWKLVSVSADGKTLSISAENIPKFQKIGDDVDNKIFSLGFAEILGSARIVEFSVTEKFVNKNGKTIDLNTTLFPGGITVSGADSSTGNIQIFVSPRAGQIVTVAAQMAGGYSDKVNTGDFHATNEIVDAHEFGHAWDILRSSGPAAMGAMVTVHPAEGWKSFENAVRSRNPNDSQRRTNH